MNPGDLSITGGNGGDSIDWSKVAVAADYDAMADAMRKMGAAMSAIPSWLKPDPDTAQPDDKVHVNAENALQFILDDINAWTLNGDEEVLRAAREWLTRVTNEIGAVIRGINERKDGGDDSE